MKIVQVVTQMEAAGVQRVAHLLHRALLERGHDSELWFLYFKRSAYSGPGIHVLWDHKPSGLENLGLVKQLFARIRQRRPDVIIAHTYYANILGHLAGLLAGTGTRVAVQHNPIQTFPAVAGRVDWIFGALGIYTAQVAVSQAVVDSMAAYPARVRNRLHCIHNGIEVGNHEPSSCSPYLKCIPASVPKILNVGRLSRQKNHRAMLETIAQLPNTHLVLVGEGEIRTEIECQIRDMKLAARVTFVGEVPPEDVRAIMRACDVFLFPSLWEAMPMALLEAMAEGMAIVASDIPANCEALQGAGITIPPQPSKLAIAIDRLLRNPLEASELGRQAAERARHFTVQAMVDGYERLFPVRSDKTANATGGATGRLPHLNHAFGPAQTANKHVTREP